MFGYLLGVGVGTGMGWIFESGDGDGLPFLWENGDGDGLLLCYAFYIVAGGGVDADAVAGFYEEGGGDGGAGFYGYFFGATLCGVAADGWGCFGDGEVNFDGWLEGDDDVAVLESGDFGAGWYEMDVLYSVGGDSYSF